METIVVSILGSIITAFASIITIILTNTHHAKITKEQLEAAEKRDKQNYIFELKKLNAERIYNDRHEIIKNLLLIIDKNNLTENYIMDISNTSLASVNKRYEEIKNIVNTVIEKLYLSFPQFKDQGYKIAGKCNEIWGNEQNYFGFQKDKVKYQLDIKTKLCTLYKELNEICCDLLNSLQDCH